MEGEGALHVRIEGNTLEHVALRIYEPPRLFAGFLRGRHYTEPPDITARICGICPVAYQMAACHALEAACGVVVDGPVRDLRRLLYCGEWIEGHALHVYMLHAPDFLGYPSGIHLAADHRSTVEQGLRLKKVGNDIIDAVGGRPIHPVNVRLGGFHRAPDREVIAGLVEPLEWAHGAAVDLVRWVAGFDFPDLRVDHELVSLRGTDGYPVLGGRIVSDRGLDIDVADFDREFGEEQVAHSTALHGRRRTGDTYLTGPLARWANNRDLVPSEVDALATELGVGAIERNPFRSIVIRALEVLIATVEAQEVVAGYVEPATSSIDVIPTAGVGWGVSEAPRGILVHRYETDETGTILDARIVPPTSQNQAAIEADVRRVVEDHLEIHRGADPAVAEQADHELRHRCETAVRNHDPCISCATHFLTVDVPHLPRRDSEGGV